MASFEDEVRVSSGSSAKAMKLLGLSKLPPDASRSQHLSLIRQHRSARKERAKSTSPMALKRSGSSSTQQFRSCSGAIGVSTRGLSDSVGETRYRDSSLMMAGGGGGGRVPVSQYSGAGEHEGYEDEGEGDGVHEDVEGMSQHQQTSEWLDMRQAPLKLTPTDLDEKFVDLLTDLMSQFPAPPTPYSTVITDLTSPVTTAIGRGKGDNGSKRAIHMGIQRMVGGMAGGGATGPSDDVVQKQVINKRGSVRELEAPMRINYAKPGDVFSL